MVITIDDGVCLCQAELIHIANLFSIFITCVCSEFFTTPKEYFHFIQLLNQKVVDKRVNSVDDLIVFVLCIDTEPPTLSFIFLCFLLSAHFRLKLSY